MMTIENASENHIIAGLQQELASAKNIIAEMKEQIDWLKKQLFGAKSERLIDTDQEQLQFPGLAAFEQESQEGVSVKGHTRKKISDEKTKIEYPEDLPKKQIFLQLIASFPRKLDGKFMQLCRKFTLEPKKCSTPSAWH